MTSVTAAQTPGDEVGAEGVVTRPDGLRHLTPERADAFLGLVRAGLYLAQELDTELEREHGISLRGFEVLLFLAVFAPDGHLRMSQLSAQAPLSQSRVSRLVTDLERRGLVERSPVAEDGRGVRVAITTKGIEKFRVAQETHLAGLQRHLFSHLTEDEIRRLGATSSKIIRACTVPGRS